MPCACSSNYCASNPQNPYLNSTCTFYCPTCPPPGPTFNSRVPPAPPYNSAKSAEYSREENNPQFPVQQGGQASQLTTNTQGKYIFNYYNNVNSTIYNNGGATGAKPYVMFRSSTELTMYRQAQFSQPPTRRSQPTVNQIIAGQGPYIP